MITVSQEKIDRVNNILAGIQKGPERVFSNALNRGLEKLRTESGRMITQTYHIRRRDFAGNVKIKRATTSNTVGEIEFAGNMIPLFQFKVSGGTGGRKPVSVAVLKDNAGTRLDSAYVANLGRYGPGVFERDTSKRETSQQLYGPSVAHMMGNEDVLLEVDEVTEATVHKRIEHEIDRILGGY